MMNEDIIKSLEKEFKSPLKEGEKENNYLE